MLFRFSGFARTLREREHKIDNDLGKLNVLACKQAAIRIEIRIETQSDEAIDYSRCSYSWHGNATRFRVNRLTAKYIFLRSCQCLSKWRHFAKRFTHFI